MSALCILITMKTVHSFLNEPFFSYYIKDSESLSPFNGFLVTLQTRHVFEVITVLNMADI